MRKRSEISTLEPTRYEVAVYTKGGRKVKSLGLSVRKTKAALLDFARDNGEFILSLIPEDEQDLEWTYNVDSGVCFGLGVFVAFTGLTERDLAN